MTEMAKLLREREEFIDSTNRLFFVYLYGKCKREFGVPAQFYNVIDWGAPDRRRHFGFPTLRFYNVRNAIIDLGEFTLEFRCEILASEYKLIIRGIGGNYESRISYYHRYPYTMGIIERCGGVNQYPNANVNADLLLEEVTYLINVRRESDVRDVGHCLNRLQV